MTAFSELDFTGFPPELRAIAAQDKRTRNRLKILNYNRHMEARINRFNMEPARQRPLKVWNAILNRFTLKDVPVKFKVPKRYRKGNASAPVPRSALVQRTHRETPAIEPTKRVERTKKPWAGWDRFKVRAAGYLNSLRGHFGKKKQP